MEQQIIQTIKDTMETVVNGKIDKLHQEFIQHKRDEDIWQQDIKDHLKKQDEKIDELIPIIEGKRVIVNLRKFLIWVATPISLLWAFFEFVLKK